MHVCIHKQAHMHIIIAQKVHKELLHNARWPRPNPPEQRGGVVIGDR